MQLSRRGLLATTASALVVASIDAIVRPTPALAAVTYRYGVNFPHGAAAVDYAYGPDGTWQPLTDVGYQWNYYQAYATARHPFDRDALIAYADGTRNMTAPDANGHLLLDFDHDGELDVTSAGFAFREHSARGAGNVPSATSKPFSMFWFDDNWLARYMAQAYGRPLPDGLSAYPDFTRWRILDGNVTAWTPYQGQAFDQLALNGLYHLALARTGDAMTAWRLLRDRSGNVLDAGTGLHGYPRIEENYHLGLFKILTEQLIARGGLGAADTLELVQHSVSLRSAVIRQQEATSSGGLTGWVSHVAAGTHLMNTETLAVNVLALGAGANSTFGPGQAPMAPPYNGYSLSPQGVLSAAVGVATPGHMTYGPHRAYPAGTYTVEFVLRSTRPSGRVANLDVYDAQSGQVLTQSAVTATNLGADGKWRRVALSVTVPSATNSLEFRTWWYGTSDLEVAEIRVR